MSIATGYVTIGLMMGGRLVFDRLGWAVAAFITPSVLLLFGGAFFAFSLSGSAATASAAVFAGAITQVRTQSLEVSYLGYSLSAARQRLSVSQCEEVLSARLMHWALITAYMLVLTEGGSSHIAALLS